MGEGRDWLLTLLDPTQPKGTTWLQVMVRWLDTYCIQITQGNIWEDFEMEKLEINWQVFFSLQKSTHLSKHYLFSLNLLCSALIFLINWGGGGVQDGDRK